MEPVVSCLFPNLHLSITSCSFRGRSHAVSQNGPMVDTVESSGLFEKARLFKSLEELHPSNKPGSASCVWSHSAMTDPKHSLLLPLLTNSVSIFKALLVSASSPAPFTEMLRLCVYSLSAADWHGIHSGMVSGLPEKSKLWQCAL